MLSIGSFIIIPQTVESADSYECWYSWGGASGVNSTTITESCQQPGNTSIETREYTLQQGETLGGGNTKKTTILEWWDDNKIFRDNSSPWNKYLTGTTGDWDRDLPAGAFRIFYSPRGNAQFGGSNEVILYPIQMQSPLVEGDALVGTLRNPTTQVHIGGSSSPGAPTTTTEPLITQGTLAGLLFKSGDWESDFDEIMTKGQSKIALYINFDDGTKELIPLANNGACVGASDGTMSISKSTITNAYKYNISIDCTNGGLVEGNYSLVYAYDEAGSLFGQADVPFWQAMGTVEFSGSIEFELKNTDSNDGYGKLLWIGPATGNEPGKANSTAIPDEVNGIYIDVTETSSIEGTFADIMNRMINIVLSAATDVIDWGGEQIHKQLIDGNDIEVDVSGSTAGKSGIRNVWENTRNMGLSLLTLVLIMVAFANILNIKLDQYGISRIIPKIIIAIVLTYFSFLIAAFLLDLMSALQALLFQEASNGQYFPISAQINGVVKGQVDGIGPNVGDMLQYIPQLLFLQVLVVCIVLVILWLLLVLYVRAAMIYILVALAPLAFLAMILPFSEKYYTQWWASFWKWAFMGPAIAFMLWLTQQFLSGYGASAFGTIGVDMYAAWTFLIAAAVMLWLTANLPLKMGGEIYSSISKVGGKAPGVSAVKNRLDSFKTSRAQYGKMSAAKDAEKLRSGLSRLGYAGKLAAGTRGVFREDKNLAKQTYGAFYKDKDQNSSESDLEKLTKGGTVSLDSPRVVALLEKIAGEFHASTWSDSTKRAMATAVAAGSGKDPSNVFLQDVARKLEGNPNKDTAQMLYLHAHDKGYAGSTPGFVELEKSAVKKASGKNVLEFSKDDDRTTDFGRGSADADTRSLATGSMRQRDQFFRGPNMAENQKVYEQKVTPKARGDHEARGYRF